MEVSEVNDLYLIIRNRAVLWAAPDLNGAQVALHPQPVMLRAALVNPPLEQGFTSARGHLNNDRCWLFTLTGCPDGPPYRSALIFTFQHEWPQQEGGKTYLYRRATTVFSPGPEGGIFLTGSLGHGSLWRLFRAEIDAFNRWLLTLSPIQLSSQCPQADFSGVKTPLLADEIAAQYAEMARAITTNSYREIVTKAKNVVEAIVAERLGNAGKSRDLSENLDKVQKLLAD